MSSNNNNQAKKPQAMNNPFMDAMNNMQDMFKNNKFEFPKDMSSMMDVSKVKSSMTKNMEVLTAANQACMETMQNMSRRTVEMMQQNAQHAYECAKHTMDSNPQDVHHKGAHCMTNIVHNVCEHAKEAVQHVSKTGLEVMDMMNKRAAEASHEFSSCCVKADNK